MFETANKRRIYAPDSILVTNAGVEEVSQECGGSGQDPCEFSAIYGQGLLDLAAATAPMGEERILLRPELDGPSARLGGSFLNPSAALGDALARATRNRRMAVFDQLDAPFFLPLDGFLGGAPTEHSASHAIARLTRSSDRAGARELGRIHFVAVRRALFSDSLADAPAQGGLANPWLRLADGGMLAAVHFGGNAQGVTGGVFFNLTEDGGEADLRPARTGGFVLRYAFSARRGGVTRGGVARGGVIFGIQTGALIEDHAALGLQALGAFGSMETTATFFTGLDARWAFSPTGALFAGLHAGYSPQGARTGADALFGSASPLLSGAFELGWVRKGLWSPADRLTIRLSQPLRVERGEAILAYAAGRRPDRSVRFVRDRISLSPSARALDLGVSYALPFENGQIGLGVNLVRHPGHARLHDFGFSAALGVSRRF